jgi:hypothetical protein
MSTYGEVATIAIAEKSWVMSNGTVLLSHFARTSPSSISRVLCPSGAAWRRNGADHRAGAGS